MRYSLRTLLILMSIIGPASIAPTAFAQERPDPGKSLYGEWEIVEMIHRRTVQDFGGESGGWFVFEPDGFLRASDEKQLANIMRKKGLKKALTERCIIREHEIDIWAKPVIGTKGEGWLVECSYELRDGKLRLIWRDGPGGKRPTDFDEAFKDPALTLFVLKKRPK